MFERSTVIPDPNAKRDKALSDIAHGINTLARELTLQNRILARIERNTRPEAVVSNTYLDRSEPDAGTGSETGDPGDVGSTAEEFLGTGSGDNSSPR